MFSARILCASLSILGLAACNPFRQQGAVELSTGDAALNSRWHANLASPATLAGIVQMNGSASMAPAAEGGGTVVTLDLANASPGGVHPWEARSGQCGTMSDGGVFGIREAYKPLEIGSNGRASGSATVQIETPEAGRYFVVVHASDENSATVVACGNLAPPTR
jgi:hypothetical protein